MSAKTSAISSNHQFSLKLVKKPLAFLTPDVSPHNPNLPLAVMQVPAEEVSEFRKTVVARYLKQIKKGFVQRALAKFKTETVKPISDKEYVDILTKSTYAKSISPALTPSDRSMFGLSETDAKAYFKFDFRHVGELTPLQGLHLEPNVALLSKDAEGEFSAEAIWINNKVFHPADGDAWALAQYHVLSTGISDLMFAEHPMVHFPMDAVNALSRTILPQDHVVYKLIYPHTYLHLPLNYGVLNQQRSVLYNKQKEIYTPYSHQCEKEIFQLLGKRYKGQLEHGHGSTEYSYPMTERAEHTDYDRFLNAYYHVIYNFVEKVISEVEANDPHITQWAKEVSSIINGFPSETTIWQDDNLVRAVTGFIWNCGIVHSYDHFSVGELPADKVPFRVRLAPPSDDKVELDRSQIMNKADFCRQRLATDMFVKAHVVTKFIDADYGFETKELNDQVNEFKHNLKVTDENLPVERFMRLDQFAASIQF